MNIITRTLGAILTTAYLLMWTTLALSQTGEENYPPPPAGVRWGWQGEVLFEYNKATLHDQYQPLLLRLAETLRQYPNVSLLITGRADNTGNLEYNRRLSLKRIEAVKKFLTKKAVDVSRIIVQNLGEERPVSLDACNEDRPRNRRTDLAFFPTGSPPPLTKPVQGDTQPQPGECEQIKEDLNVRKR
jgi:hypothetical protein